METRFDNDLWMQRIADDIRSIQCPHQVNVTSQVMQAIGNAKPFGAQSRTRKVRRISMGVAAALALCLLFQVFVLKPSFNDKAVGMMFAEAYAPAGTYSAEASLPADVLMQALWVEE